MIFIKTIPLFIIAIFVVFGSLTLGYDIQPATNAAEQNPGNATQIDSNHYILISTTTAEDDFCKKYLETCPSDDGNIPDTNNQPNNNNYAYEFERKYMEEDNNNKTITTQQQPLVPGVNINGTFANETLIVPQQPQPPQQQQPSPTPNLPRATPPPTILLPPTF